MAIVTTTKFVLPIPAEFIRHVTEAIILQTKNEEDLTSPTIPIVTRAKLLVAREGLITATFERES